MPKKLSYQNIEGSHWPPQNPLRAKSKFYNEGRWKHFIEPLLPKHCKGRSFIEIGCNAGLYLSMAERKGFSRIIGTEKDKHIYREACRYRERNGGKYSIIKQRSGVWNCDYSVLPVSDVVLMSCVHYHMRPVELIELLDHLYRTCQYCILVSVRDVKQRKVNRVGGDEKYAMNYFKNWKVLKTIRINADDDPTPRSMYSMLFESNLVRCKIHDLLNPKYYNIKLRLPSYVRAFSEFCERILNKNYQIKDTEFYDIYIAGRRRKLGDERKRRLKKLIEMIETVSQNGLKKPLLVNSHGHLLDGSHRVILLKHLGYEYVLCREVY